MNEAAIRIDDLAVPCSGSRVAQQDQPSNERWFPDR